MKVQISQLLSELRERNSDTSDKEKQSELQLPAMQLLTSKTSNQAFFLRILKVHQIIYGDSEIGLMGI